MQASHIIDLILQYKYLILVPLAILEGPILSFIAGFLVSIHVLKVWAVFVIIIGGDAIGDTFYYCLGRYGGSAFIQRFGRYLNITPADVAEKKEYVSKNALRTVFMGKFIHVIGVALLFAAGMAEVPYRKFMRYAVMGSLIQSCILVTLGYFLGRLYGVLSSYFYYESLAILAVAVVGITVSIIIKKYKRRK